MSFSILLFFSCLIRLDGVTHNYPYLNQVDEGHIVRHAMDMFRDNSLDAHWYEYSPGLMNAINVSVFYYKAFTGTLGGFWDQVKVYGHNPYYKKKYHGSSVEYNYNIVDPPVFLLAGRLIVVLLGTLSVAVVYFLLRLFFIPIPIAFLGGWVFSSIPAMVIHTHIATNDIPMTLAAALLLLFCFLWQKEPSRQFLLLMGGAVGFSMSFKYTGMFLVGLPVLLILAKPFPLREKARQLGILALACLVALHIFCPNLFLTGPWVLAKFLGQSKTYAIWKPTPPALKVMLDSACVGIPFMFAVVVGIPCLLLHRSNRLYLLLSTIWFTLLLLVFLQYPFQPVRNLFQILPMMTVLAVWGIWHVSLYLFRNDVYRAVLGAGAILFCISAYQTIHLVEQQRQWNKQQDSRVVAIQWLEKHAERGTTVCVPDGIGMSPAILREVEQRKGIRFVREAFSFVPDIIVSSAIVILPQSLVDLPERGFDNTKLNALKHKLEENGMKVMFQIEGVPAEMWHGHYMPHEIGLVLYARGRAVV